MSNSIAICLVCGRERRVKRFTDEGGYCEACVDKVFAHTQCKDCGGIALALTRDPHPRCVRCRHKAKSANKPCLRCGKVTVDRQRKYLPDGQMCCTGCWTMLKTPVACHYCGKVGLKRSRNYQLGFTELACRGCQGDREKLPNCAGCHRPRRVAGEREGKSYCAHCLPSGHPPLITCKGCHQQKYAYAKEWCEDCSWERSNRKLVAQLLTRFKTDWGRQLFEDYHREAKLQALRGKWRKALKRDVDFFLELEKHFPDTASLSGVLIVRHLGVEATKRYRRAMSFLSHKHLILLDEDPDYLVERVLDRLRMMIREQTPWIADVVQRFLHQLLINRTKVANRKQHTRIPSKHKSLESSVRSAIHLLNYAVDEHQATSVQEISQNLLDQYLGKYKLERMRARSFVRYFNHNEKIFHKLKFPKATKADISEHLILPEPDRRAMIDALAKGQEVSQCHWRLIYLFNYCYAQLPARSVKLKLDDVRETETGYQIKFAKVWLDLDERIVPVMRLWMTTRREWGAFDDTGTSRFLFPGMRSGTHITPSPSTDFSNRYKVNAKKGRATALATLVRNGMNNARVMCDCIGISNSCAIRYCVHFGARQSHSARVIFDHHAQH